MDTLLQKLRQNMAELSLQGDDFTRQIWHMYATFEEFIDHQQSPSEGDPPKYVPKDAPPPPAPGGGFGTSTPTRDAVVSNFKRVSPTMSNISPAQGSIRINSRSPPTTSDDLALTSPRRSRRRRPRRLRRSVDNPLLDTISAIGVGDSDEEPHRPHSHPHHNIHHHFSHHSPSFGCCSRLHPETDSIGYAGSNSVDSGYKSACPTPDLSDGLYLDQRLEKRGSLASLASSGSSGGSAAGTKPRIAMGTRVISRGGCVPRSPVSGISTTPPRKMGSESSYYELDQLAALRQALLGSPPSEIDNRNSLHKRYSPSISTNPSVPRDTHISRRAASPASPERRPRSASTGSRSSPGTRNPRKPFPSNSPMLSSTGSLPRSSSPGRRLSLSPATREEQRPPTAWSRHSSPGIVTSVGRIRRPPSPIVGIQSSHGKELARLEKEIDALLYGDMEADFYDIESGTEYPGSYCGTVSDSGSCLPSITSTRKLREDQSTSTNCSLASETAVSTNTNVDSSPDTVTSTTSCPDAPRKFCTTDVADCVLAMVDDLTRNIEGNRKLRTTELVSGAPRKRYRRTPFPQEHASRESDEESCCSNCSEYHLYEEIIYEGNQACPTDAPKPPSPPPLPARPPRLMKPMTVSDTLRNFPYFTSACACSCRCEIQNIQPKFSSERDLRSKSKFQNSQPASRSRPPTPPMRTTSQKRIPDITDQLPVTEFSSIKPTSSSLQSLHISTKNNFELDKLSEEFSHNIQVKQKEEHLQPRKLHPPVAENNESITEKVPVHKSSLPVEGSSQTTRPKQRSNIYSLFKERKSRRILSASLEMECNRKTTDSRISHCSVESLGRPTVQQIPDLSKNMNSAFSSLCAPINGNQYPNQQPPSNENIENKNFDIIRPIFPSSLTSCSLDLSLDDDYGFQIMPHIV